MGGLAAPIYRDRDEDGVADLEGEPAAAAAAPAEGRVRRKLRLPPPEEPAAEEPAGELSDARRDQLRRDHDLPRDREDFNSRFRTTDALRALGLRIPRELGGPYRMREGTTARNAKTVLVKLFKRVYNPAF